MKSGKQLLKLSRTQWISVAVLASSLGLAGAAVTIPFQTFTGGTAISASQVNANFAALANSMPAAKTVTGGFTSVTTVTTVDALSLTVTPPSDGFVIVTGSGNLGINIATAGGQERINVYLTTTSGGTSGTHQFLISNPGVTGGQLWAPFSIQDIFPVTGGTPSTFYLTAAKAAVTATYSTFVGSEANDTRLTAVFVPGTALP